MPACSIEEKRDFMGYLATLCLMIQRIPTPMRSVAPLICDRFHQGLSYSNWRPAGSHDWLLIYCEAGAGQFTTPLGQFTAPVGEAVLYAPGELQDYRTAPEAKQWELLWVHFRPRATWDAWLRWPRHPNGLGHLELEAGEARDSFHAALLRMLISSRRSHPDALEMAFNALEEALLWAQIVTPQGDRVFWDARVRQAADHLRAHLREPFRLEMLARRCGLSVSRFAHLFKAQTGDAPQQWFEKQRMQHACHLLRLTSLSVAQIGREVGYDDPFYFSNRFRRSCGQSPLSYRVEHAALAT